MIKIMLLTMAILLPNVVMAEADVRISISAEKEVVSMVDGQEVTKRIVATEALPGDIIFYTVHFENKGDKTANNVDVIDPIPSGMTYIDGSVFGPGSEVTFSIDQGKTYKQASLLTYQLNGKQRMASPESYSHIRWVVKSLDAGKSGIAGFQARVK